MFCFSGYLISSGRNTVKYIPRFHWGWRWGWGVGFPFWFMNNLYKGITCGFFQSFVAHLSQYAAILWASLVFLRWTNRNKCPISVYVHGTIQQSYYSTWNATDSQQGRRMPLAESVPLASIQHDKRVPCCSRFGFIIAINEFFIHILNFKIISSWCFA